MPDLADTKPTAADQRPLLAAMACERCGSPIEREDRFCPGCGNDRSATALLIAEVVEKPAAPEQRRFACKNCGAEVAVDPDQRSYTCAFCDSNYVVELTGGENRRQPPEFVVGFSVTKEAAHEKFKQWIGTSNWFRPDDLHRAKVEENLRGVYLPFWSFSMLARSRWSAWIGEYWYRTESYTTQVNGKTVTRTRRVRETEWWHLDGRHHEYHSGYLVSGSRGLKQADAELVKPFYLTALRRYEPRYLAGWLSEEYSVDRPEALATCRQEFLRRECDNVAAHLPGDTHRDLGVETELSEINSDLILLPVYLLSYRYGEKLYRFMINGQTGKAVGYKPWSWLKIGLAAAVVAALAVLTVILATATK
ncbi:MAG TPA: zinc ribbon domain-containing protein [Thermoguttaceae bacterium]|nr:zinc ribbon domain-containing protein [Thermoguttaceae bacterium]